MKRIFIIFSVLLIAGSGCTQIVPPNDSQNTDESEVVAYIQEDVGLSFSYVGGDDGYMLEDIQLRDTDHPELVKAVRLMRTPDWIELQGAEGREGPPMISVLVFKPEYRQLTLWLEENNGFTGFTGESSPISVSDVTGRVFEADGLYKSRNVAFIFGEHLYLFSATYHETTDGRLDEFAEILESVEIDGTESSISHNDAIELFNPDYDEYITSPLLIQGEARGNWFFEALFPLVLTNWDGLIIAEGYATALDDWMTTEYVPFEAQLTFKPDTSVSSRGSLILQKANASGLPEHDDALEITVYFSDNE